MIVVVVVAFVVGDCSGCAIIFQSTVVHLVSLLHHSTQLAESGALMEKEGEDDEEEEEEEEEEEDEEDDEAEHEKVEVGDGDDGDDGDNDYDYDVEIGDDEDDNNDVGCMDKKSHRYSAVRGRLQGRQYN